MQYPSEYMMTVSRFMDRLVKPRVRVMGKIFPAYFFFVVTGLAAAATLASLLVAAAGASLLILLAVIGLDVAALLLFAMLTKIFLGAERYTFYHYMIIVLLLSPVMLGRMGAPVFPYQDIIAVSLILNLAIGRTGCFMAGCCHGKPHRWGVLYGEKHMHAGSASLYDGIRLFPLQLLEVVFALIIVATGAILFLYELPGNAFAWMVVSYALLRYGLEYFRGDADRPFYKGFSEAQWTSAALVITIAVLEWARQLPFQAWHTAAACAVALSMAVIAAVRQLRPVRRYLLLNPNHISELSVLIDQLAKPLVHMSGSGTGNIQVGCTSLGIQLSMGVLHTAKDFVHHYTFSNRDKLMNSQTAKTLADLIVRLWYPCCNNELIDGKQGTYHLLINHRKQ